MMKRSLSSLLRISFVVLFLAFCFVQPVTSEATKDSLEDDHELLGALEIFAGMSPEEMLETVTQMMNVIGDDDPETLKELQKLLELIPMIQSDSNLLQMAKEDEIAVATNDALRMIGNSDWDTVWEMQDVILDAVLESGKLTAEDAATYKTDENAWKKELKFIYDELQKQAKLQQQQQQHATGAGKEL